MSTSLTSCPECGAANAASVQWCGQCYTPFGVPTTHEGPESPDVAGPVEDGSLSHTEADLGTHPAPSSPPKAGQWTCRLCETSNEVEASDCTGCGTEIFEALAPAHASEPEPLTKSAYAFPGLALNRADRSIEGAIVMFLAFAGIVTMLLIPSWPVRVLLLLFVVALWVIGIRDATSREPLLTVPVLRWVMVGYGVAIMSMLLVVSTVGSRSG